MFTELKKLYDTIDNTTTYIAKDHGREIKCARGCSDCCHAAFDISLIEGHYIIKAFRDLPRDIRRTALKQAQKALKQWKNMIRNQEEISTTRIRCPLLDKTDCCIVYHARPVNCRTYGVPTEANGTGHVCGLSGFKPGRSYPTVRLDQIQQQLLRLSAIVNKEMYHRRWPVAAVLLAD